MENRALQNCYSAINHITSWRTLYNFKKRCTSYWYVVHIIEDIQKLFENRQMIIKEIESAFQYEYELCIIYALMLQASL